FEIRSKFPSKTLPQKPLSPWGEGSVRKSGSGVVLGQITLRGCAGGVPEVWTGCRHRGDGAEPSIRVADMGACWRRSGCPKMDMGWSESSASWPAFCRFEKTHGCIRKNVPRALAVR